MRLQQGERVVEVSPTQYLGDRFGAYREAVASCGGRYLPAARVSVVPLAQVSALLRTLTAAGLPVATDPALAARLRAEAADAEALAEAGRARLAEAEARLIVGATVYPYQREGIQWLAPRRQALLADEMGLGKTIQALLAAPADAAILVVAPAACAANWLRECRAWRPDLRPRLVTGRLRFEWPAPGELICTTYGSLPGDLVADERGRRHVAEVTAPATAVTLIADEAHALKSAKTARTLRWRAMRDAVLATGGRVWLLTGTPLLNRPPELWSVLGAAALDVQAFGTYQRFAALFHAERGRYGMSWGTASPEVPIALRRVSLHRRRLDVLPDLPSKTRQSLDVALDSSTRQLCDALVARLAQDGLTIDDLVTGTRGTGVAFELISRVRAALAAAKLAACVELVESYDEAETPVVVFCAHVDPLRALAAREGWGLIDGSLAAEDRAQTVAGFQAGRLRGLAVSYAAGGVGITITRASHAIHLDLPWTPALVQQAEDRLCRIGQRSACQYVRLVADHPLEQRVLHLLDEKLRLIESAVEASAVGCEVVGDSPADTLAAAAKAIEAVAAAAVVTPPAPAVSDDAREQQRAARLRGEFATGGESRGAFRPPQSDLECWAAKALVMLAALDPDRASVRNDVGFSQADEGFGHSLAQSLVEHGRLSDKQWACALKLARRYRRQVGSEPAAEA
jgi:hypothetical protein